MMIDYSGVSLVEINKGFFRGAEIKAARAAAEKAHGLPAREKVLRGREKELRKVRLNRISGAAGGAAGGTAAGGVLVARNRG